MDHPRSRGPERHSDGAGRDARLTPMRQRMGDDGAAEARAAAATGLAVALVGVVALCSSTTPWRSGASTGQASERALESIAAVGAVALVAGAVLLWIGTPPLHRRRRKRRVV